MHPVAILILYKMSIYVYLEKQYALSLLFYITIHYYNYICLNM